MRDRKRCVGEAYQHIIVWLNLTCFYLEKDVVYRGTGLILSVGPGDLLESVVQKLKSSGLYSYQGMGIIACHSSVLQPYESVFTVPQLAQIKRVFSNLYCTRVSAFLKELAQLRPSMKMLAPTKNCMYSFRSVIFFALC